MRCTPRRCGLADSQKCTQRARCPVRGSRNRLQGRGRHRAARSSSGSPVARWAEPSRRSGSPDSFSETIRTACTTCPKNTHAKLRIRGTPARTGVLVAARLAPAAPFAPLRTRIGRCDAVRPATSGKRRESVPELSDGFAAPQAPTRRTGMSARSKSRCDRTASRSTTYNAMSVIDLAVAQRGEAMITRCGAKWAPWRTALGSPGVSTTTASVSGSARQAFFGLPPRSSTQRSGGHRRSSAARHGGRENLPAEEAVRFPMATL